MHRMKRPRVRTRKTALARRATTGPASNGVVPLRERRLSFGKKWDYAPAPETVPVQIAPRYELFIGGRFAAPASGKYFDSINPATEEKLTEIALAGKRDIDRAVKAARQSYDRVW